MTSLFPSGRWIMIERKTSAGGGGLFDANGWDGYKKGFGNAKSGDYWLGLEKVHQLTLNGNWKLMFKFRGVNGGTVVMIWNNFKVSSEEEEYRLSIGGKRTSWGDYSIYSKSYETAMKHHNGQMFSTKDRDNDTGSGGKNCAKIHRGGFWYYNCRALITPTEARSEFSETIMAMAPM